MVYIDEDLAKRLVENFGEFNLAKTNECILITEYVDDYYIAHLQAYRMIDGNIDNKKSNNMEYVDPLNYIMYKRFPLYCLIR